MPSFRFASLCRSDRQASSVYRSAPLCVLALLLALLGIAVVITASTFKPTSDPRRYLQFQVTRPDSYNGDRKSSHGWVLPAKVWMIGAVFSHYRIIDMREQVWTDVASTVPTVNLVRRRINSLRSQPLTVYVDVTRILRAL